MRIYIEAGCGLRGVSKILAILQKQLCWDFDCTPSYNTIENWVKKSGYSIYKEPFSDTTSGDYAIIFDESMMVGSQKMLLTLGINARKQGIAALCPADVEILKMSVQSSWNKEKVADDLKELTDRIGHPPCYVISDNGGSLTHAVKKLNFNHMRDVGHTLGVLMERIYKNDKKFISYMQKVALVKFQHVMKSTGYLLAPKQRTIARFLNLSEIVHWSAKMLSAYPNLSLQEQETFSFIPDYASLIKELHDVLTCVNAIFKDTKTKGLSGKTYQSSILHLQTLLSSKNQRMILLAESITDYLNEQISKMPDDTINWNISSDVIESLFGVYKDRKSPNSLYGMTAFSLFLPIYTRIRAEKKSTKFDFKRALEHTFMSDIEQWRKINLIENQVTKRINMLKSA